MLISRTNGATSVILRVKLLDSSVTTGAGLTGLTSASSGLIISTIASNEATATTYTVAGSTIETITTLGTYAAPTATKCRFKEVDATNHKGVYEIQLADARFAISGSRHLLISVSGATNLAQADFIVDQAAASDVTYWNGTAIPGVDTAGYPKVTIKSGTGTGEVNLSSGRANADIVYVNGAAVSTSTAQLGVNAVQAGGTAWGSGAITSAAFASGAINAAAIAADAIGASELAADAVTEIVNAVKAAVIETNGSVTLQQAVSVMLSALAGVTSSGGTVLKDPSGTSTRITATVDGSNNRTAMTLTPSS